MSAAGFDETLDPPAHGARRTAQILSTVLRTNWTRVLLGLALISGGTITQYFLIAMTPYAIRTLHLPASTAMLGSVTLGMTGGSERWLAARWPTGGESGLGARAAALVHARALPGDVVSGRHTRARRRWSPRSQFSAFLHAMSVAVGVILIPLIFPPAVRSTGLAITYSLGVAIFGGTATYVVTWLVGVTGDPLASTYYVMAANVVMLAGDPPGPQTEAVDLERTGRRRLTSEV